MADENKNSKSNNISPKQLAILANLIAIALCEDTTVDEMNVIGNFLVGIGSLVLTIAVQTSLFTIEDEEEVKVSDLMKQLQEIQDNLKEIKKKDSSCIDK